MVYQIIQDSPWHYIFGAGGLLLFPVIIVFAIFSKMAALSARITFGFIIFGVALIITCVVGLIAGDQQRVDQNDANFSKQLMDEYGVTSSRSLYEIDLDFSRFDEARTVFTKGGKETSVYIKLVHNDDEHYEMAFTVIDNKDLYPKPSK